MVSIAITFRKRMGNGNGCVQPREMPSSAALKHLKSLTSVGAYFLLMYLPCR